MTTKPDPSLAERFRKPTVGPTAADVADRDLWDELSDQSLTSVQTAAEKWRTGLAAFVTLATGGLLFKGPEAAKDIPDSWLAALTLLGGGGLVLAITGLWQALRAAAGSTAHVTYERVMAEHKSVRQFQLAAAKKAAASLGLARRLVGFSLALLLATVFVWWWAPETSKRLVRVTSAEEKVCGELLSADGQRLRVQEDGVSKPTMVQFADVGNLHVVDKC